MFFLVGILSQYIFGPLLFLLSLFIIAVILLQRGKGGGLTGALGGLGGQSAFGVKAGDLFTRITAIAVLLWIFFCALACRWYLPEGLSDITADAGASSSIGAPSNLKTSTSGSEPIAPLSVPGPETQVPFVPPTISPATDVPQPESPQPESPSVGNGTTESPAADPSSSEKQP